MVDLYDKLPDDLNFEVKAFAEELMIYTLESEIDEMLSFVGKKANKQWIWIALDVYCRQIIAFQVGDRSRVSAQAQKEVDTRMLPEACYVLYRWLAGLCGCDSSKAASSGQKAKADNQSYRTIQLHVETASFPSGQGVSFLKKKLSNHIGAIKYFICHYNLKKALHV